MFASLPYPRVTSHPNLKSPNMVKSRKCIYTATPTLRRQIQPGHRSTLNSPQFLNLKTLLILGHQRFHAEYRQRQPGHQSTLNSPHLVNSKTFKLYWDAGVHTPDIAGYRWTPDIARPPVNFQFTPHSEFENF